MGGKDQCSCVQEGALHACTLKLSYSRIYILY